MTANQLLDALKDGRHFSYQQITQALVETGDLVGKLEERVRSAGMDEALERPSIESRDKNSESLVVKGYFEDRGDPRPWCSAYLASRHETSSL